MIPDLARALAGDTLPQAIARGEQAYTGEAFSRLLEALHDDPATAAPLVQAACDEWSLYARLLREKSLIPDPRGD